MALAPGSKVGPYAILSLIGAGGMGEVYRAHDTRLKRDVALKVLPEVFAGDPERMARFQREAEVLASLNHPNIAHIYGVEERALVMELVEGESPKGPMPFDEAWEIASQIAAGLEYAHEKGIVHRDLKPANVKVTPDGVVKLLDFGLAKAFSTPATISASLDNSPTLTLGATQLGVILGTAAYMAPEQAKGKTVDKRADIWSFGVVLFELLTGDRLFAGDDVSETLADVLKKQPDFHNVPIQARQLLRECLEKDPKDRLRDVGDAKRLLATETAVGPKSVSRGGIGGWITAGVLFIALGIPSFLYLRQSPPRPLLRYSIAAPENTTKVHSFAISPDGRLVAIAATVNGKRQLWVRPLDALRVQPIPGTDDATYPFWSPDSRYIAFFAQGELKKVNASGGPPQSLCAVPDGRGGTWSRDDVIVFSPNTTPGGVSLQRVSAAGGVPTQVTRTKGTFLFPVFLPDGRHFLYLTLGFPEQAGVYLASLDGKENRRVLADDSSVAVAARTLLFIRENTLMAQPFDEASGTAVGEAFPVVEGVSQTVDFKYALVTASETGVLLYQTGGVVGRNNQMAWYDRSGKVRGDIGPPSPVFDPALSPDQKLLAFQRGFAGGGVLWTRDLARGAEQRFTTDTFVHMGPIWSPNQDRIAFSTNSQSRVFDLYQKAAGGTGPDEPLLASGNPKFASQWSRDGRFIVYFEVDPKTRRDIWVLPVVGSDRKPMPFLRSAFNEINGQLSPDGHWMAYTSDESGQREVYVRPFPAGDGQWKISIQGGEQPRWRGDGKELFFLGANDQLMAVAVNGSVAAKPSFDVGQPQPLFEAHLAQVFNDTLFEYDVTADGTRFLLDSVAGNSASAPQLNVVINWSSVLKK